MNPLVSPFVGAAGVTLVEISGGSGVTGLATADGGNAIADNELIRGDGTTGIQGSGWLVSDLDVLSNSSFYGHDFQFGGGEDAGKFLVDLNGSGSESIEVDFETVFGGGVFAEINVNGAGGYFAINTSGGNADITLNAGGSGSDVSLTASNDINITASDALNLKGNGSINLIANSLGTKIVTVDYDGSVLTIVPNDELTIGPSAGSEFLNLTSTRAVRIGGPLLSDNGLLEALSIDTGGTGIYTGDGSAGLYANGYGIDVSSQYVNLTGPCRISDTGSAPVTATDPGASGQVVITATHIYYCVDSGQWVRAALAAW